MSAHMGTQAHRGAPERLHRGQASHDGVVLGHASCAQRQACGDHCWQALRDGRHRQRHRYLEVVKRALHLQWQDAVG